MPRYLQPHSSIPLSNLGEVHEMFKACVDVGLFPQAADAAEVGVVHVRVHSEEALKNCAHHIVEVGGKGNAILLREDVGVIQLQSIGAGRTVGEHCETFLLEAPPAALNCTGRVQQLSSSPSLRQQNQSCLTEPPLYGAAVTGHKPAGHVKGKTYKAINEHDGT